MKTVKNIITQEYTRVSNELAAELVAQGKHRYCKKGALKSIQNKARKLENNNRVLNNPIYKNSISKRFIQGKNFVKSILKKRIERNVGGILRAVDLIEIRVINFGA